jgi:hypothetical protein
MSKATLHELVIGERRALSELLDETEGELTPEIEQLLTELDLKIDDKLESVGLYVLGQTAIVKAIKEEEARLAARRKAVERGVDGLKAYAERMMREAGKTSVKGTRCTVALQKNPPSVKGDLDVEQLRNLATIEEQFDSAIRLVRRVPETFSLDRRAVLELHKGGDALPEGLTVEQGESLRIR